MDKFDDRIDDYLKKDFTDFYKEGGSITYITRVLDGISLTHGSSSLNITTESIHQSLQVMFKLPNGKQAQKSWLISCLL